MGCKNFVFRERWVGSEVAGMKVTIFNASWTHILTTEDLNKEFFKKYFNFQLMRKTNYTRVHTFLGNSGKTGKRFEFWY